MDLWQLFRVAGRHRCLVAALLVLTLGGATAAVARIAPTYEVGSTLVLMSPPDESPDTNPFRRLEGGQVLAQVAAQAMRNQVVGVVTADRNKTVPVLRLVTRDADRSVALQRMTAVTAAVRVEVERLQRDSGAAPATWIRLSSLSEPPEAHILAGSRVRALAGLLLAAFLVTCGAMLMADGFRRRRRQVTPFRAGDPPWLEWVGGRDVPVRREVGEREGHRSFDAVAGLTVFVVLLFALPSRLVFKPLGAAGTPAMIWAVLMLLWWASYRLVPSPRSMTFQPVRLGLQVLGAAALLSYAGAFFRPIDGVEILAADRAIISLAGWSGIALLAADGITSRARLRKLLERLTTGGALLASLGIVQFFTSIDIRPWFNIPGFVMNGELVLIESRATFNRVAATAIHPIEFSLVLTMLLPVALHLALHSPPAKKRFAWLRVALLVAAVPMAISRTGILGLVIGGLVMFVTWPARRRWQALALASVSAVAFRLLVPGLLGSIRSLFFAISDDTSFTGRTDDYVAAARYFLHSPLIGRGWGTFLPDRYILLDNQYLGTVLEGGIIAVVSLLLLFALGIGTARGARRRATDSEGSELGQALTASIAVAMAGFATFDAFAFPMAVGTLFLLLGSAGALWRLTPVPRQLQEVTIRSSTSAQLVGRS